MRVVLCLILWALAGSAGAQSQKSHNGDWWLSLSGIARASYVMGYAESQAEMIGIAAALICPTACLENCLTQGPGRFERAYFLGFRRMSVGQVTDGVDVFYGDYRNRRIDIHGAMVAVQMSIAGAPDSEVAKYIERRRRDPD